MTEKFLTRDQMWHTRCERELVIGHGKGDSTCPSTAQKAQSLERSHPPFEGVVCDPDVDWRLGSPKMETNIDHDSAGDDADFSHPIRYECAGARF